MQNKSCYYKSPPRKRGGFLTDLLLKVKKLKRKLKKVVDKHANECYSIIAVA